MPLYVSLGPTWVRDVVVVVVPLVVPEVVVPPQEYPAMYELVQVSSVP